MRLKKSKPAMTPTLAPSFTASIEETQLNLIAEDSCLEGSFFFENLTRIHGRLKGKVQAKTGSILILSDTGMIEGDLVVDTLLIDGFIRGNIQAETRVILSSSGRVVGNIQTPALKMAPGAYFEGQCFMPKSHASQSSTQPLKDQLDPPAIGDDDALPPTATPPSA